jgi:hypothetical protein
MGCWGGNRTPVAVDEVDVHDGGDERQRRGKAIRTTNLVRTGYYTDSVGELVIRNPQANFSGPE